MGAFIGFLLIIGLIYLYFLPAITANKRKLPNRSSILTINLCLGWTLIGWVVAMSMAQANKA